jgi:HSP20 family protein
MTNVKLYQSPRAEMVPARSLIEQLLEGSYFAPLSPDRWFNHPTAIPANLIETDDAFIVQLALPGLDSKKLDIQVLHRDLRIRAIYEVQQFDKGTYVWHGLQESGEFSQTFTLPAEVSGDGAEATYTNGVMTISVPKAEHTRVKSIHVKTTV